MSVSVRAAATVVLLRDTPAGLETLLLRRQADLAFAAGKWVFPGGAIDTADYADAPDDLLAAARRAAAREAYEEAGLKLDPARFDYIAHWTTPSEPNSTRRYATWFFAAPFAEAAEVVVDGGEIAEHRWVSPAQALQAHRQQVVELMPPTFVALVEIAHCRHVAEALAAYGARPVIEILPKVCRRDGRRCMLYPGDAGYETGDPAAAGPRHRTSLTDAGWRYERTV